MDMIIAFVERLRVDMLRLWNNNREELRETTNRWFLDLRASLVLAAVLHLVFMVVSWLEIGSGLIMALGMIATCAALFALTYGAARFVAVLLAAEDLREIIMGALPAWVMGVANLFRGQPANMGVDFGPDNIKAAARGIVRYGALLQLINITYWLAVWKLGIYHDPGSHFAFTAGLMAVMYFIIFEPRVMSDRLRGQILTGLIGMDVIFALTPVTVQSDKDQQLVDSFWQGLSLSALHERFSGWTIPSFGLWTPVVIVVLAFAVGAILKGGGCSDYSMRYRLGRVVTWAGIIAALYLVVTGQIPKDVAGKTTFAASQSSKARTTPEPTRVPVRAVLVDIASCNCETADASQNLSWYWPSTRREKQWDLAPENPKSRSRNLTPNHIVRDEQVRIPAGAILRSVSYVRGVRYTYEYDWPNRVFRRVQSRSGPGDESAQWRPIRRLNGEAVATIGICDPAKIVGLRDLPEVEPEPKPTKPKKTDPGTKPEIYSYIQKGVAPRATPSFFIRKIAELYGAKTWLRVMTITSASRMTTTPIIAFLIVFLAFSSLLSSPEAVM